MLSEKSEAITSKPTFQGCVGKEGGGKSRREEEVKEKQVAVELHSLWSTEVPSAIAKS